MLSFDTDLVDVYLNIVFSLAALSLVLSLGVVATGLVRNRRVRLSSHQSLRTHYGSRLALHH